MDITEDRRPEGANELDAFTDRAGLGHDVRAEAADGEMLLRAEHLVGGAEKHEWARVRVSRRIVTEERQITVPVRREELVVEYLDGAEPQARDTAGSAGAQRRPVEEFVLHEEVPRVEMDVVAREKVQVFVETLRREVVLSDQVSREEVRVEGDGIDPSRGGLADHLDGDGLEHLDRR